MPSSTGVVYLVGAGPGDPGLITRRGAELLERAEVIVHDGLVDDAVLDLAAPSAECIYAGKKRAPGGRPMTQDDICRLLVERASAGQRVVRLKGGDPFVFGRGAEECQALARAGIDFEIVPGVSAATAVPAYAGIPLTARNLSSTVSFATGHEATGKPETDVDWRALAHAGTVVLFMAVRTMAECCEQLIAAGRPAHTPAAVIRWGTTARQEMVISTLGQLPRDARGVAPPALIVVGQVVELASTLDWHARRPLAGARVAITRDRESAAASVQAIADLGGAPLVLPLARTEPVRADDPEFGPAIERALAELDRCDWVLFTSANAVDGLFDRMLERGRDARALARARVACVGRATARSLAARGLLADLVPTRGDGDGAAQAILSAMGEAGARGLRVLFPRAAGGRDEALATLTQAGAQVDLVPVYRTVPATVDTVLDPMLERGLRRLQTRSVDAIAFFAPSQVQALFDLCERAGADGREIVRACPLVAAIGNTTKAALTRRGVDVDVVPPSPDAGELVRALAAAWRARRHEKPARLGPAT